MLNNTIKALRLYNGMTQEQFASEIGYSITALSMAETGARAISPRFQSAIARRFQLDDDFLLFLRKYEKVNSLIQDNTIQHI